MLFPVMPHKANELRAQLGLPPVLPNEAVDLWPSVWGGLRPGNQTEAGSPLFPRFDERQEQSILERLGVTHAVSAVAKTETKPMNTASETATIEYDDFAKIDLRVGVVREAEKVPKSKKLLRLQIDVGEGSPRQVLAGISEHYEPSALVGKRVVVVANLKPRKMRFGTSEGMVLAAGPGGKELWVLETSENAKPGTVIS